MVIKTETTFRGEARLMKKMMLILGLSLILSACSQKEEVKTKEISVPKQEMKQTETKPSKEEKQMTTYVSGDLIKAVEANDLEKVKEIVQDRNYDINEINEKKESPLLIATHNNQVAIAKVLIDYKADVNQQDEIQDSPYLYAGAQGKTEIIAYMLENSHPDQHVVNRFGGNALIPAAEKGHLDNVKLLLADGDSDIDHQNNLGYTALIEAVALRDGSKVYQDIVAELLKYGADTTLRDIYGKTAADYAKKLGYQEMLEMLEKR